MPRYDYQCHSCQNVFELRQSFSAEPVSTCPKCQSSARRLIHSVPVVFKGSGFYVNDYGKGSNSNGSTSESNKKKPDKKTDAGKTSNSETKGESDSKPESPSKKEPASTNNEG